MTEAALIHPGDEDLIALSQGRLSDAELTRVSSHLGDCPACCSRIDGLVPDDCLVTRLRQGISGGTDELVGRTQRRSAVLALRQLNENTRRRNAYAAPVALPVRVGDYDVLAEVGRGGMGVVYRARHRTLHRPAALKMVLSGEFASPVEQLRFRLEAELAARVRHPNIVQVYEVGTYDGRPFLAMEWVEGGSLADRLTGAPWPPAEAASLVETLARAIHVAHAEGIVHRDLKPANVLLTADGVPKITDFGLARPVEDNRSLTRTGVLVGTPGYMAPEQAAGARARVGPATDVYSLGVVLYELLTGRPPFRTDNTLDLLRAVATEEPPRPRLSQPRLSRDLEAVTLHCLEKEPHRRYLSALALAEDLARFRDGTQVQARPVGSIARFGRACRRRPLVASLLALLATSLFAGLAGVTWKWREANENASQAESGKRAALDQAYRASLAAACAAIENHDVADAARHLESAPEALRGWEWWHLASRLDDSSAVIPIPADGGGVLIAGADRLRIGVWTDAGLRLSDPDGPDGRPPVTVPIIPQQRFRVHVCPTDLGLRVVAWDRPGRIDVFDGAGRVLSQLATDLRDPTAVVMSPDGTRIACSWSDNDTHIDLFNAATGRMTAVCRGHTDTVWTLAFSPDGTRLASGGEDRTVRVWNVETGESLSTGRGHASKVVSAAFHPDGTRLVTTSSDGTVRQWETHTGRDIEAPYDRHSAEVYSAVYSPDGQCVASAGADRTVRVWRAKGRQDVAVLHGHKGRVSQVAFSPDGRRLLSLSRRGLWVHSGDDTVRVWDVDPVATLPVLRGHTRAVHPLAVSRDGLWLASGSRDATVCLWDAATGEPVAALPHPAPVWDLAFGPDGTWLVTVNALDDRLRIWDSATGLIRKEISSSLSHLQSLAVSPDGIHVALSASDPVRKSKRLSVFDVASGERRFAAEGSALTYSPDGRWLAGLAGDSRTVLLRDASTHETIARFVGHEREVLNAAFCPDGRFLATCGKDATVRFWPIDGGECRVLRGHTDEVSAVAFHPDGTRLATGCLDGAVWLWDVARGEDVLRLPGHRSFVGSLVFSPGGETLTSASGDSTIRLWDTEPLKARYAARRDAAALRPEAERLVERLAGGAFDPAVVMAAIRTDPALADSLRHAAFRTVLRRTRPTKPNSPFDPRP